MQQPEDSVSSIFVDIVFLKAWVPVNIPQYYNPVTTLLLPVGAKDSWQGMKTVGEMKREKGIKNTVNIDHLYKVFVFQIGLNPQSPSN